MAGDIAAWQQQGNVHLWRYADAGRTWRGWQWSAAPDGCRSLRNLLDRMQGGGSCHRTLQLATLTDAVLKVPGVSLPVAERFNKLRVDYCPCSMELRLEPSGEVLILTVGNGRLRKLAAALAQVEIGHGDFDISPSDDRKADRWMFWWAPDINYFAGRRSG